MTRAQKIRWRNRCSEILVAIDELEGRLRAAAKVVGELPADIEIDVAGAYLDDAIGCLCGVNALVLRADESIGKLPIT